MPQVKIIINGGNNQILPNATQATQVFCGNQPTEEATCTLPMDAAQQSAMDRLSIYIDKDTLPRYVAQMGECQTASELARVVVAMAESEPRVTPELMVKARFIGQLLPFAPKVVRGRTVDNVRQHINDAWAARPRIRR